MVRRLLYHLPFMKTQPKFRDLIKIVSAKRSSGVERKLDEGGFSGLLEKRPTNRGRVSAIHQFSLVL